MTLPTALATPRAQFGRFHPLQARRVSATHLPNVHLIRTLQTVRRAQVHASAPSHWAFVLPFRTRVPGVLAILELWLLRGLVLLVTQ